MKKYINLLAAVMIVGCGINTGYANSSTGCQALAGTTWTASVRLSPDFDRSKPELNDVITINIDSVVKGSSSYGLRGTMSSTGSDNFSSVPFYGAGCDQGPDGKITWVDTYVSIDDSIFHVLSRNSSHSESPTSLNIPRHAVSWKSGGTLYSSKDEATLNKL